LLKSVIFVKKLETMILKKRFICIALLHSTLLLFGQAEFKNVVVTSSEGRVTIDYDLQPTVERAVLKAVRLTVVFKGETIVPKTVGGAIGTEVSFGLGRRMIWSCVEDGRIFTGKAEIFLEADCEVLSSPPSVPSMRYTKDVWKQGEVLPPPPPVQSFEPETVLIEGGTFQTGERQVTVSSFWMGIVEITVRQFRAFIESERYQTDAEKNGDSYVYDGSWQAKKGVTWNCDVAGNLRAASEDTHPVIHVSWNDAIAYCKWLSGKTGKTYRLATEAEWEYAARGGNQSKNYAYSGSSSISDVAWYDNNSGNKTHAVGGKQANKLGLYDLSGNVWEWCHDWYGDYSNSTENPLGDISMYDRVIRGGSWLSYSEGCRPTSRGNSTPTRRYSHLGFRVVCSLQ
jgi:formylglycine-generating enzyme required for sulfatase activity